MWIQPSPGTREEDYWQEAMCVHVAGPVGLLRGRGIKVCVYSCILLFNLINFYIFW